MTADVPDLTVAELELIRDATLRAYQGGDEEYDTLPQHLLDVVVPDGGLVNMIDLAIRRTCQLEYLRTQVQQDYAAIHTKQQRDAERIAALEKHVTLFPAGAREEMLNHDEPLPQRMRDAIARARQRREEPNA